MAKLSEDELAEMRRLATQARSDSGGPIDQEHEPDPMIQLRRCEIGDLQRWLLRATEEIENLYTSVNQVRTPGPVFRNDP
jgi:hypothetical protein